MWKIEGGGRMVLAGINSLCLCMGVGGNKTLSLLDVLLNVRECSSASFGGSSE